MSAAAELPLLVLVAVPALLAAGLILWLSLRKRPTPAALERRRRLHVNAKGRMASAMVIDVLNDALHYSYMVGGMEYSATQDISAIAEFLPRDPSEMFGPATVKYLARNPANSILICEEWSGLRAKKGHSPQ